MTPRRLWILRLKPRSCAACDRLSCLRRLSWSPTGRPRSASPMRWFTSTRGVWSLTAPTMSSWRRRRDTPVWCRPTRTTPGEWQVRRHERVEVEQQDAGQGAEGGAGAQAWPPDHLADGDDRPGNHGGDARGDAEDRR